MSKQEDMNNCDAFSLPDGRKLTPFITVKKYIPMGKLLGGIIFKSNEEMWVTKNFWSQGKVKSKTD